MKILSDEKLELAVKEWVNEDFEVRSISLSPGHYEDILPVVAQAQHEDTIRQIVELLTQWRDSGRHLISFEAIEEIKKLAHSTSSGQAEVKK